MSLFSLPIIAEPQYHWICSSNLTSTLSLVCSHRFSCPSAEVSGSERVTKAGAGVQQEGQRRSQAVPGSAAVTPQHSSLLQSSRGDTTPLCHGAQGCISYTARDCGNTPCLAHFLPWRLQSQLCKSGYEKGVGNAVSFQRDQVGTVVHHRPHQQYWPTSVGHAPPSPKGFPCTGWHGECYWDPGLSLSRDIMLH